MGTTRNDALDAIRDSLAGGAGVPGAVWDVTAPGGPAWVKAQQALVKTDNLTVTLPATAATAAKQDTGNTSLANVDTGVGTDGAAPPSIAGTGVRGWLRAIYDRLVSGLARTWTLAAGTDAVTATQGPAGASAWKVDGSAVTQPVSGPLTDAQLRAVAVPVSGTVTASGPLTDTQLRASAVPVSAASLPLPAGAATETTLAAVKVGTDKIPAQGQAAMAASTPVVLASNQSGVPVTDNAGSLTVDAPVGTPAFVRASDGTTAQDFKVLDLDSGAGTDNRIAIGLALAASGGPVAAPGDAANGLDVDVTRVSGSVTVAQATAANLTATVTQGPAAAATAPWPAQLSDGAAAYVGAKTGQLPAALVGARLDANVGAWLGSTAPTVGVKTGANSVPVVLASDHAALPLSTDAATQTTLALVKAKTDNLDAALSTLATQTTLAQIKTDVDKIPASPATDRATAAAPFSVQLSDAAAFYVGTKTGQLPSALGQAAMAASVAVALASDQSALPLAVPTNRTASGTLAAAGATLAVNTQGAGGCAWEIDAGLIAQLVFEATFDGTNWFPTTAVQLDQTTGESLGVSRTLTVNAIARGLFVLYAAFAQVRLRVSVYGGGSAAVRITVSAGAAQPFVPRGQADMRRSVPVVVALDQASTPYDQQRRWIEEYGQVTNDLTERRASVRQRLGDGRGATSRGSAR